MSRALLLCLAILSLAAQAETYDLGRTVGGAEIALWDIDVRPDGLGLPPGSGSVDRGEIIYAEKCASCHGADGTGGPFDVLVGRLLGDSFPFATDSAAVKTVGNYWPYATTLFDYINRAMPFDAPGSLPADDVYALVAYVLFRNEIVSRDTRLSAENLPAITMPAHGRFVLDDRSGGHELR